MNLTAMVIGDSRGTRNTVMQALTKAHLATFTFIEATDGADGIAKFNPEVVDICFIDWSMPVMAGVEFVKNVRSTGGACEIPVVVTGERSVEKIEEALAAGADAHICKPFAPEDMQVQLQKVMHKLESRQQPSPAGSGFFSGTFN